MNSASARVFIESSKLCCFQLELRFQPITYAGEGRRPLPVGAETSTHCLRKKMENKLIFVGFCDINYKQGWGRAFNPRGSRVLIQIRNLGSTKI